MRSILNSVKDKDRQSSSDCQCRVVSSGFPGTAHKGGECCRGRRGSGSGCAGSNCGHNDSSAGRGASVGGDGGDASGGRGGGSSDADVVVWM